MNRQQQRQLKKHPLIRLIRGIFRLIRVIFKPAKNARMKAILQGRGFANELAEIERIELERAQIRQAEIEQSQILAAQQAAIAERYITVGDLLDRVQWQSSSPKPTAISSAAKLSPHDVSLN
jgi:hypothetical protein